MLATVKGDVHDIGKNLVDIILSNNGYDVVNIGIKQPISAIVAAAEENGADVIGMSGLLVKSTVVMRDNLAELNSRGLAGRWPVLLGGAALTRGLRGAGSGRAVRRRGPLRPGRLRGAAPDGRRHGGQARRARRQSCPSCGPAGSGASGRGVAQARRSTEAERPRHRSDVIVDRCAGAAKPPFLGHRGDQGHPAG